MKKRQYRKPTTDIVRLSYTTNLLIISNLEGELPAGWEIGIPGLDR